MESCPKCGSKKFFQGPHISKDEGVVFCEQGHQFLIKDGKAEYRGQRKVHSVQREADLQLLILDERKKDDH